MKKLIPLAFLCAALAPASAMALEEGVDRAVDVAGRSAGTMTAFLLESVGGPTGYCVYIASWESELGTDSVECELLEQKSLGHTSCVNNSQQDIDTVILSGLDCQGYDQFNRVQDIDFMILGEEEEGDLSGSVIFSGSPILKPVRAR